MSWGDSCFALTLNVSDMEVHYEQEGNLLFSNREERS